MGTNGTLSEKALLVRLNISQWTAKKFDKGVTAEVHRQYSATDAGRWNKTLVNQTEAKKISVIVNQARAYHYYVTLPWLDDGTRILPSAQYMEYTKNMQQYRTVFDDVVDEFCSNYSSLIHDAQARLKGMFNWADYPSNGQIRARYGFDVGFTPIPDERDFRVDIADEEMRKIREETSARAFTAQIEATKDLWRRLHEVVAHMVDRLSDDRAVFRDSLVSNVVKLVEILPSLNISNDPELEEMRRRVEAQLTKHGPSVLRDDKVARATTAECAEKLLDKMAGYVS